MIPGEKVTINGAILTKRIVSAKVGTDDESIRSYIPRSQKIIAWIELHADEIDNRKNGNLVFSFSGDSLKARDENIYNL